MILDSATNSDIAAPPHAGRPLAFLLAVATLFYATFIGRTITVIDGRYFCCLFDDAMISMRYAQNFAEGFGLLWNPGQAPVEGYTNFLWTLWMALWHLAPLGEGLVSFPIMVTGAALLLANVAVVWRLAFKISGSSTFVAMLASTLVAFYYPLIFWTLRGMEVGLMVLLVDLALLWAMELQESARGRDLGAVALVLALAILVRPDAVVPYAIISTFIVLTIAPAARWRAIGALSAAFLLPLAGHTAFRSLYYHEWLPNTYYLKVMGVPLIDRLARGVKVSIQAFAYHLWPMLIAAIAGGAQVGATGTHQAARRRLLIAIIVGQAAYAIYVGGDAWEWVGSADRFLVVAVPSLLLLASAGIEQLLTDAAGGQQRCRVFLRVALPVAGAALACRGLLHGLEGHQDPRVALFLAIAGALIAALPFVWGWATVREAPFTGGNLAIAVGKFMRPGPVLASVLAVVVLGIASGRDYAEWVRFNARHVGDDAKAARLGLQIRRSTQPTASVAVIWAGNIPYFSRRPCVDLFGKSDAVIAKGPPATPVFFPGHNKWNVAHSIGELRPDVVAQFWGTMGPDSQIVQMGYTKLPNGLFVRQDSQLVNRAALGAIDLGR